MTGRVLALATALLVAASGCAAEPDTAPPVTPPVTSSTTVAGGPQPLPATESAIPETVTVPSIDVTAPLVPLGIGGAGELEAPTDFARAGWYDDAPTPGDPGPAVIAGHVDSVDGPAVFYRLNELEPGDSVTVSRSDGRTVEFTVDGVQKYPKDDFPTAAVFGPTPGSTLRLITCGGTFDHDRNSYRDNIVVYATAPRPDQ